MLPELWAWQAAELAAHADTPKRAIFASPRLGKTRVAAEDAKRAFDGGLRRGLITAPLSVCPDWVAMLEALGVPVYPLYAGSTARVEAFVKSKADGFVVLNDDKLARCVDALLKWAPSILVADESHRFKSPSSARGRAMRRLAWHAERVRLLTGTPAPNHFGNLWGQMVAVDRDAWYRSYGAFADEFLIRNPVFPSQIIGHKNTDELQSLLLRYATVVRREDVFGPDTFQTVYRDVDLPAKGRKIYDTFAAMWILDEPNITADNVLVRLLRLQQIAMGFVTTPEGTIEVLHEALHDRLLADLAEIVESGEKAIVYHQHRWEGERAAVRIASELGVPVYTINGDTSVSDRTAAMNAIRTTPGSAVAVVQIQAGGTGISFAEAEHVMFLSRNFSFSDMEQARDRVYKPGARRVVTIYRATGTVHEFQDQVLDQKTNVHSAVRNADRQSIAFGSLRKRAAKRTDFTPGGTSV